MSRSSTKNSVESDQLGLFDVGIVEKEPTRLVDSDDRYRISHDLDTTLFVEAGAGAGKTSALTSRIVALVLSGVPMTAIAAITFTEKAAADLRRRIRLALESVDHPLARQAIDGLDGAAIGTLHSFAGRILREFPVEVGLPPAFSVLDEVGSDIAFEVRWTAFLEDLFGDDHRGRLVLYADADGLGTSGLRDIAVGFGNNWDLVEERVDLEVADPTTPDFLDFANRVIELCSSVVCPTGDKMEDYLADVLSTARLLRDADDEFAALQIIHEQKFPAPTKGAKTNWKRMPGGEAQLDQLKGVLRELKDEFEGLSLAFKAAWQPTIGALLGKFSLDAAKERRQSGKLEFHDLLVLARDLVRDHPSVRHRLHDRYQRLLLDEFQDTDPIQLELAVWLAADPTNLSTSDWRTVQPLPGRLFFVGDPKQSIYRFRRADIAQFLSAREQVGAQSATLSTNFRSSPAVLDWVNRTFGTLISEVAGEQPPYTPLDAFHREPGSVAVLGLDAHDDSPGAEELRSHEAHDVAQAILTALNARWPVSVHVLDTDADGVSRQRRVERPCRLGDIAILVPARTSLPILQDALVAAGVPFQAENASLVYATAEIRALLLAMRAIDDATDELALISTLRSPLFGCSDRDLYEWKQAGGTWRIGSPKHNEPSGAVSDALGILRTLVADRHWLTPSQLLQQLVDHCRVFEVALSGPGARDAWRRVRFIIDQARAWSDAGGWGLRNYLMWTRRQGDDGRYVAEAVLPETDLDAVRIMTIHAAKGLEFPIVIVSGLTTKISGPRKTRGPIWTTDGWTISNSEAHQAFKPVDEQLNRFERLRLLYVACTRAESHLVVSLHRTTDLNGVDEANATLAELLAFAQSGSSGAIELAGDRVPNTMLPNPPNELAWNDAEEWDVARLVAIKQARRPRVLAATTVAKSFKVSDDPGLDKDGVDLELPPWQRGRYGSAIGRAVHGVLQAIDFSSLDGLERLVAAQASAEGIAGRERVIAALATSALGASIVQLAATRQCWRELYVAAPIGDQVIEGYVDLLVRTDRGLVLVDYKTDFVADDGALALKVDRYSRQLAAYGIALETVLGEPIAEARLVMCSESSAREIIVSNWAEIQSSLRHEMIVAATNT